MLTFEVPEDALPAVEALPARLAVGQLPVDTGAVEALLSGEARAAEALPSPLVALQSLGADRVALARCKEREISNAEE